MRGAPGIPNGIADLSKYQKGALRGSFFILIFCFGTRKSHKPSVASTQSESRQVVDQKLPLTLFSNIQVAKIHPLIRHHQGSNPPQAHTRGR